MVTVSLSPAVLELSSSFLAGYSHGSIQRVSFRVHPDSKLRVPNDMLESDKTASREEMTASRKCRDNDTWVP